jgi:hypothetical protein
MVAPKKDIQFSVAAGAKIVSVTDSSTAVDHGTPIDINIKSFSASPEMFEAEQRHDGKVADRYIELEKFTGQFVMSKVDLEVLALVTGNSVESTGNDQLLEFVASNLPGYFAVGFKSKYSPAGVGSKNYVMHKCKATNIEMSGGDREYGDVTITFDAIPRAYDDKVGYLRFCDADTAISFADLPA